MLYPIYVHKEAGSAYAAAFPDIPGCFAGADDIQALPRAAQEAVEAHFGVDDDPIPAASAPDAWADHPDYQDGGFWMLVDIDLSRVRARAVRLNISLPENLVQRIDATARQRGQSRSAFLATAAEHEMADVRNEKPRSGGVRLFLQGAKALPILSWFLLRLPYIGKAAPTTHQRNPAHLICEAAPFLRSIEARGNASQAA